MRLDHIALYVRDLEAARDFFLRFFGAQANGGYHNPKTGLRTYFITFDGGARLEIMTRPAVANPGDEPYPVGYAHAAFSMGSREAVDRLSAELAANGYPVLNGPRVTGDGYYESVVQGPEGCLLELTA